jgi:hypothetical protein
MPELDDLLREFRAEVPPPAPGAAERIAARARAAVLDQQVPAAMSTHSRAPRTRIRARLAVLVAGIAAAVTLVVALSPGGDHGTGASAGTLLDRAEAAVTPRQQILALTIRLRETTRDPSVVPEDREREIRMREYVLAGAGDALATRLLITEGSWTTPPTDEDSTMLLDRDGELVEHRSWTPWGNAGRDDSGLARGNNGLLGVDSKLPRPVPSNVDPTLTGVLRDAYERGDLRPVGPRDGDELLLRGHVMDGGCGHTEVWLDPHTFIPRRIEVAVGKVNFRSHKCDPEPPLERELWTIDSQQLEANDRNRRLLEIGNWPTARYELNGKQVGRDELPPRPPLDEQ